MIYRGNGMATFRFHGFFLIRNVVWGVWFVVIVGSESKWMLDVWECAGMTNDELRMTNGGYGLRYSGQ